MTNSLESTAANDGILFDKFLGHDETEAANMLTPEEMNQYSYGKILEISKKNFKTISENMDINLSRINPVVHSLIQKKRWQTDPVWTNFYFNWISYCHNSNLYYYQLALVIPGI